MEGEVSEVQAGWSGMSPQESPWLSWRSSRSSTTRAAPRHDRSARVTPFGHDGFGEIVPLTDPLKKAGLLEVFVWFPSREMMLLSQRSRASGRCEA